MVPREAVEVTRRGRATPASDAPTTAAAAASGGSRARVLLARSGPRAVALPGQGGGGQSGDCVGGSFRDGAQESHRGGVRLALLLRLGGGDTHTTARTGVRALTAAARCWWHLGAWDTGGGGGGGGGCSGGDGRGGSSVS